MNKMSLRKKILEKILEQKSSRLYQGIKNIVGKYYDQKDFIIKISVVHNEDCRNKAEKMECWYDMHYLCADGDINSTNSMVKSNHTIVFDGLDEDLIKYVVKKLQNDNIEIEYYPLYTNNNAIQKKLSFSDLFKFCNIDQNDCNEYLGYYLTVKQKN